VQSFMARRTEPGAEKDYRKAMCLLEVTGGEHARILEMMGKTPGEPKSKTCGR
jgi:hypothetical protein